VGTVRGAAVAGTTAAALALTLTGCTGHSDVSGKRSAKPKAAASRKVEARRADPTRLPGISAKFQKEIPSVSRQVVTVYGRGRESAESTVRLYTRTGQGRSWALKRSWAAHNGRKGWTTHHHDGDKRSPVGVFTLTDAGGVLPAADSKLPYSQSTAFTPSPTWPKRDRHDFDHVIAIDYNRIKGTSPLDPSRPQGASKGGSIWLHVDHGSGTSACVSISKSGMDYLLRTLSTDKHPLVVMGDKQDLAGDS
jgi:L,D-peptidoglycan transpeptidase YkuD (ErfK/YbiS/YcfS/YnhG family)